MSLFESVWVKLACERCGKVQETIIRFHSYSGRPDGEYDLMEVVPQGYGLSRGEVWEGNADRYCEKCHFAWSIAQATAAYDALAELIERGLVTARAKASSAQAKATSRQTKAASVQTEEEQPSLPAAAINAYAEQYVRNLRKEGCIMVTMPYFEELDLTIADKPVPIGDDPSQEEEGVWSEFLTLIDPLLSDRMQQAGWVADGCTWEDFNVSLDDARHIVVEDMQGRRLNRDGTRDDGSRATQ